MYFNLDFTKFDPNEVTGGLASGHGNNIKFKRGDRRHSCGGNPYPCRTWFCLLASCSCRLQTGGGNNKDRWSDLKQLLKAVGFSHIFVGAICSRDSQQHIFQSNDNVHYHFPDDGETPVEHLASAPLHSHELLPLQRYKSQKTLQNVYCWLF